MIVTVTPNPVLDRTMTVPRIKMNEMVRAVAVSEDWGGKGINVSRALRALGVTSVAMGFVGGATGVKLEQGLHRLGVMTDLVKIAGETRTNIVIREQEGERYVKANEAGPEIAQHEVDTFFRRALERVQPDDLWALCGSLPPGVPSHFYAVLIRELSARGAKVALDTSGDPLHLGIAARPYLVKPNLDEAGAWLGRRLTSSLDATEAVAALLARGVSVVALSLGAEGLLLATEEVRIWARPPRVTERNPVGAGDALLAGISYALEAGMSWEDVARWGVAAGTAAATLPGVAVGTRREVARLLERVTLAPWPKG